MRQSVRISESDTVAVALVDLPAGARTQGVVLVESIRAGHKFALSDVRAGEAVIKYGYPIGVAKEAIAAGQHVHTHNVHSDLHADLEAVPWKGGRVNGRHTLPSPRTFMGYRRPNGKVAVRNEIWILPTVGCVNQAAMKIAEEANRRFAGMGIDGVHAFTHPFGCSQLGGDLENTQRIIAGLAKHPNAAGVLLIGLGCENNQMKLQLEVLGHAGGGCKGCGRLKYFNTQDVEDEIETGLGLVEELVNRWGSAQREPIDVSELVVGMKCGGSDGFSGITGNPLVGRVADRLCGLGGTVMLTEVPEMFGAETVLMERAADEATFHAIVGLCNGFRGYFRSFGQPIDENPSPGNKAGGITTNAEKSLGCVQKGGHAPVVKVLGYGERATPKAGGVVLINAPGNDGVSSTALAAAGAHLVLFTTGRGNPLGTVVPTIKISTNSDLKKRKPNWIDFDAGVLADDAMEEGEVTEALLEKVLMIASGERARNEINGCREIAMWKNGVTL